MSPITKTLVCDVETNALHGYTEMWCAVTYCIETKELRKFVWREDRGHLTEFKDYAKDVTTWIGHNFIDFDRHAISSLCNIPHIGLDKIIDTLVKSRVYNSNRDGGHSLERWGAYFHIPKVGKDIDDWSVYRPIMLDRCVRDVGITYKLHQYQQKEGKNVSDYSVKMEYAFVELCGKIRDRGFPIRKDLLDRKYSQMLATKQELEAKILEAFPARPKKIAEVHPKRTKSGKFSRNTKGFRQFEDTSIIQGPFTLIEWQEFNIGSPSQVVERLNEYGWKPVEFTKNENPKVSEINIDTLPSDAPEEAKLISQYLKLKTRIQLMDNWFTHYNEDTGKIHGSIINIGAITHRCAHKDPNTANIPGNDKWNIREVWGFEPVGDRRIVGVDAKGIQLRVLGHLTGDKAFIKQTVEGDPHMFNVRMIGPELLPQSTPEEAASARAMAKKFIYSWLLGCGNKKVAGYFNTDTKTAGKIVKKYQEAFTALKELRRYLSLCSQRGWFPAPDGRYIPIKSEFYSLSVALQGIEVILMKLSMILWEREKLKRGLDAHIIAFVHDEVQIDSHYSCAREAGQLFKECISKAGEMLGLRCPMDGDTSTDDEELLGPNGEYNGFNWSQTH